MKKTITLFPILTVLIFLISCQPDEDPDQIQSVYGQWQLEEIISTWTGEVTKAEEINFEKSYEFHTDSTFVKVNSELDRQVSGKYVVSQVDSEGFDDYVLQLTLAFNPEELEEEDNQPMGGMVYGIQGQEVLFLRRNGSLSNAGHGIADGPMFVFRK